MKHRYCDIPQDVLLRLLQFPQGTKIVRMAVVHDGLNAGPAPLRIVIEHDDFYDSSHYSQMTSLSPWYWTGPFPQFAKWWEGYAPPLGHFSYTEAVEKDCTTCPKPSS